MHKFDYSFLKKNIPSNIVNLTNVITDLKSKEDFRKLQYSDTFKKMQRKAIIESVKGSNAIEGIVTSDTRIKDIVDGDIPLTHDELEISGYKDALNLIFNNYQNLNIDENLICTFHRMIVGSTNPMEAGKYKQNDNYIMEYDSSGKRIIRFRPVRFKDTKEAMEQLILAFMDARQDYEISPLLLIPCFVIDFLCIHPFSDGNGRVSRLLTVLLLYSFGYDIVRYISFEGQVNKYKESYYISLERSSLSWYEGTSDYIPFIINFLQILYRCYKDLDESFVEISLKKASKSKRVENVLLNAIVPISKQDVIEKLPDVSIKTIELVLNKMIKEDKIKKIGSYKDARYLKNN